MEFAAAKIMKQFGGYTVKTLLDEPLNIFYRLAELANRVQADEVLETTFRALSEALNGGSGEIFSLRRGSSTLQPSGPVPTADEISHAKELSQKITNGEHGEVKQYTMEDLKNGL